MFVDVRDRSGVIQVVFEEGKTEAGLLEKAAKLRAEYVVAVTGTVEKRSGAVNESLATGEIEIIPRGSVFCPSPRRRRFRSRNIPRPGRRGTSEIPLSGP